MCVGIINKNETKESAKIKQMAGRVAKELLGKGFLLQMYCAYSTNSIYIKLDCGVCHSIRISDHKGKRELKYRYNLMKGGQLGSNVSCGKLRNYYPFTQSAKMIADIEQSRKEITSKYGRNRYAQFMEKNRVGNSERAGFWSESTLVQSVDDIDKILNINMEVL